VRIQFRGDALDLSEFENVEVSLCEITIIPLGISTATAVRLGTLERLERSFLYHCKS
jgi:hypothetical protein